MDPDQEKDVVYTAKMPYMVRCTGCNLPMGPKTQFPHAVISRVGDTRGVFHNQNCYSSTKKGIDEKIHSF